MLKVQLGLFLKKLVQEARFSPTSFPGSLSSASLGHWKKDSGCGWSPDHL